MLIGKNGNRAFDFLGKTSPNIPQAGKKVLGGFGVFLFVCLFVGKLEHF